MVLAGILGFVTTAFLVLCALVPGLWMLLFPERTFRTRYKPRWPGALLLGVGGYLVWLGFWGR